MIQLLTNDIVNDGLIFYLNTGIKGGFNSGLNVARNIVNPSSQGSFAGNGSYSSIRDGTLSFTPWGECFFNQSLSFPTQRFTVTAWAYYNSFTSGSSSNNRIIQVGGDDIVLRRPTTAFPIECYANIGGSLRFIRSGTTINAATWFSLTMLYNGSALILYRDGAEVASLSASGSFPTTSPHVRFAYNIVNEGMNGYVPVSMIYNRALSAAEVNQNFQVMRKRFGI